MSPPDPWWSHAWSLTAFAWFAVAVGAAAWYFGRERIARTMELPAPDLPPDARPATQIDAVGSICAVLGLGPEWSADPSTPLAVLLSETTVTATQLCERLQALYGCDVGAVGEETPVGAIADAIVRSARTS